MSQCTHVLASMYSPIAMQTSLIAGLRRKHGFPILQLRVPKNSKLDAHANCFTSIACLFLSAEAFVCGGLCLWRLASVEAVQLNVMQQ